jgi:hypothetical protein
MKELIPFLPISVLGVLLSKKVTGCSLVKLTNYGAFLLLQDGLKSSEPLTALAASVGLDLEMGLTPLLAVLKSLDSLMWIVSLPNAPFDQFVDQTLPSWTTPRGVNIALGVLFDLVVVEQLDFLA